MPKEIDHTFTRFITCPWCGYVNEDSHEFEEEDGEVDCQDCDMRYHYTTHIQIHYSTKKIN